MKLSLIYIALIIYAFLIVNDSLLENRILIFVDYNLIAEISDFTISPLYLLLFYLSLIPDKA